MIRAHQPGSQPLDIPEAIPNPAVPRTIPTPSPRPSEPVKIPTPQRAAGTPFITKEVVILGVRRYGVTLEYDDARKETIEAVTREATRISDQYARGRARHRGRL
jgi:hypothetical protein